MPLLNCSISLGIFCCVSVSCVQVLMYHYCCSTPSQQTKVYQHSCHNTNEAHNKLTKSKEKLEGAKGARRKKALEKDMEVCVCVWARSEKYFYSVNMYLILSLYASSKAKAVCSLFASV